MHGATTDGEGSGSRTGPALPDALVSLIPAKPSLIQQKKGYFPYSADGERNVLIRPFQRHILCRGYLEYAGNLRNPCFDHAIF